VRLHLQVEGAQAHDFLGRAHAENERRTWLVVALTSVMMVAEIAGGTIYGSMALVADGWHMLTHAGALAISGFAYRYARRHVDDVRFSFGTGKLGELGGYSSALILGIIALLIGYESLRRLVNPVAIRFDEAILIAVIGLAVNLVSAWILRERHDHSHPHAHDEGHAHHHHDYNLRSAYLHVIADALTSVLAIAALSAGLFYGWTRMDPAMGIVGALVIARWAMQLMRSSGAVLLRPGGGSVAGRRDQETPRNGNGSADGPARVASGAGPRRGDRVGVERRSAVAGDLQGEACRAPGPVAHYDRGPGPAIVVKFPKYLALLATAAFMHGCGERAPPGATVLTRACSTWRRTSHQSMTPQSSSWAARSKPWPLRKDRDARREAPCLMRRRHGDGRLPEQSRAFHRGQVRGREGQAAADLVKALDAMLNRYGFTTVVDTGSDLANTAAIRRRIESGEVADLAS
jgi:cation diffusion facilitator family transporter